MDNSHIDVRARYTRQLVREALLTLMKQKRPDRITVTDVVEKAGINRGTFYKHYANVDDLYQHTADDLLKELVKSLVKGNYETSPDLYVMMLTTIRDNKDMRAFIGSADGLNCLAGKAVEYVRAPVVKKMLDDHGELSGVDAEYTFYYQAGGFVEVIKQWITDDFKAPVAEICRLIDRLNSLGLSGLS